MSRDFLDFCNMAAFVSGWLGLPLMVIDLYFYRVKIRIEKFLDAMEEEFERMAIKVMGARAYDILASIAIPILFFAIYLPMDYFSPRLGFIKFEWWWIAPLLLLFVSFMLPFIFKFISNIIYWMNKITYGHAFLGLGVFIQIVGLIFDTIDQIFDT